MSKNVSLLLAHATLALYPQDTSGQPILSNPVWFGARAENVRLGGELDEIESTPSGAWSLEYEQTDEQYEIAIERIWVVPTGFVTAQGIAPASRDFQLKRGRYVLVVQAEHRKTGIWIKRTYYGVTAKRYDLASQGVLHFGANQVFRAQFVISESGSSPAPGFSAPAPPSEYDQPLGFAHESALVVGTYFVGAYQFGYAVTLGFTKAIAFASQVTPTTVALEVNGVVTGNSLVIPTGSIGQEVSVSATFSGLVSANQLMRWKVIAGPGSGLASVAGVTMNVVKS